MNREILSRWGRLCALASLVFHILSSTLTEARAADAYVLNLNFGSGSKTGLVEIASSQTVGNSTNDVWNLIGPSALLTVTNLHLSTGSNTTVSVTITNLEWGPDTIYGHPDAMLGSYIRGNAWDWDNSTGVPAGIVVSNLPAATYTVYCYGFGNDPSYEFELFNLNVGTNSYGQKQTAQAGPFDPVNDPMTEGWQYVVFTNVVVGAGQSVNFVLNQSFYNHTLNGIQFVSANTTPTLPSVTFTPASGTGTPVSVTMAVSGHGDATIYYTTNGVTPTTNSYVYSSAQSFEVATTLKAFATKSGYNDSAVSTATYPLSQLPMVTFNPNDGAGVPTNVVLSVTGHTNATIYFTTNGATPTTGSTVYSSPIALNTNGWTYSANRVPTMTSYTTPSGSLVTNSSVYSTAYGWKAFDHSSSTYWIANGTGPEWVSLTFPSDRRVAKYALSSTTGGDAPKDWTLEGWNGSSYVVVDTRSSETNWNVLERREYVCTNSAFYPKYRLNVSAQNATAGNPSAYVIVAEVEMYEATITIQAFATQTNWIDSNISFADYHARPQDQHQVAPTPFFSPDSGTFNNDTAITISSPLSGATYQYTTNGTDWMTYTGAVTLDRNTTLRAKASKTGYVTSLERTNSYAFVVATPGISPNGGYFTNSVAVTLTSTTTGASFEYKIGGGSWQSYTGAFNITNTAMLTVAGDRSNYGSSTNTATFTAYDTNGPIAFGLLNVNFGSGSKTGRAATGISTNDVWNIIGGSASNTFSNLHWANGSNAPITITMINLPNSGISSINADTMLDSYISGPSVDEFSAPYPVSLTVSNLASGLYNFYLYDLRGPDAAEYFQVTSSGSSSATKYLPVDFYDQSSTELVEGIQFVLFTNVVVTNGVATINLTTYGESHQLSGLQIEEPYQTNSSLPMVVFSPGSGAEAPVNVTMMVPGYPEATIYYTVNGSTPTTSSDVYSGALSFTTTTTVKAIAAKGGRSNSAVNTATYILPSAPAPSFTPAGATFTNDVTVSISSALSGANYEYSTNGTDWVSYSAPFTLDRATTLRAKTLKSGYATSMITTNNYVLTVATPGISPNGGAYTNSVAVTLTTATSGADLKYKTWTGDWTTYTGSFNLTNTTLLIVAGSKTNFLNSTNSAVFTFGTNQPPTVTISSPTNYSLFNSPGRIPLTVGAGDADGIVVKVAYYSGDTFIGSNTVAPFSLIWSNVPPGGYVITARAYDYFGLATTSSVVNVTVRPMYKVTDLGTLGSVAINNFGEVLGTGGSNGVVVWRPSVPNGTNGTIFPVSLPLPEESLTATYYAYAFNDAGEIAGSVAGNVLSVLNGETNEFYFNDAFVIGKNRYGYITKTAGTNLTWPLQEGFEGQYATGLNNRKKAVGASMVSPYNDIFVLRSRGFLFETKADNTLRATEFPLPEGYYGIPYTDTSTLPVLWPRAINNQEQTVGAVYTPPSTNGWANARPIAYLSQSNAAAFVKLGSLDGPINMADTNSWSQAYALNEAGWIVGVATSTNHVFQYLPSPHAFLWKPDSDNGTNGSMRDIGVLAGLVDQSVARAVSSHPSKPTVVGWSGHSAWGGTHAFVYDEQDGIRDINLMIDQELGVALTEALGVNNMGQIIANGLRYNGSNWVGTAFLLNGVESGNIAVTVTSPTNRQQLIFPTNYTITASVFATNCTITNVVFLVDDEAVGSDSSSPYSLTHTFTEERDYRIYAKAYSDSGMLAYSPVVYVTSTNRPPIVNVTGATNVYLPSGTITLTGTATDDGLPLDSTLTYSWSLESGPYNATFGTSTALSSSVTFTNSGVYVVRLSASDSHKIGYKDISITVYPPNQPPVVEEMEGLVLLVPSWSVNDIVNSRFTGKVIYSHDEWLMSSEGYEMTGYAAHRMALNVAEWLVPGRGSIVAATDGAHAGYPFTSDGLKNTITNAGGYNYTLTAVAGKSLAQLLEYDAVFMAAHEAANPFLTDYVNSGGSVLALGGVENGTEYETPSLNKMVSGFGLSYADGNNLIGNTDPLHEVFPIYSQHELFDGVSQLLYWNGISLTNRVPRSPDVEVIETMQFNGGNQNLFGIYGKKDLPRILVTSRYEDDGLPVPHSLTFQWIKLEGPAKVMFEDATQSTTFASFREPGEYVLGIVVSDGEYSTTNTVNVSVQLTGFKEAGEAINFNFGNEHYVGPSAVEVTPIDRWNIIPPANSGYGAHTNLLWNDQTLSPVQLTFTNLTLKGNFGEEGATPGRNTSTNLMFRSFVIGAAKYIDSDEQVATKVSLVRLAHLPNGVYRLYAYARGESSEDIGTFKVSIGNPVSPDQEWTPVQTTGSAVNPSEWVEGQQYALFRNIRVTNDTTVNLHLLTGTNYIDDCICLPAHLNGVQVVRAPKLPPVEFNPVTASVTVPVSVALSVPEHSGAVIYYTVNGSTPTVASAVYTSAITLTNAATIRTFAVEDDFNNSDESRASYGQVSIVITSPTNGATMLPGTNLSLTVTVGSTTNTGVGRVEYLTGTNVVSISSNSPYSGVISNIVSGRYMLLAKAYETNGTSIVSAPVSFTVNTPPVITLLSPLTNSTYAQETPVLIAANASDSDGTVKRVSFYAGTNLMQTLTNTPYAVRWQAPTNGTYEVWAEAEDNLGGITATGTRAITVLLTGDTNHVGVTLTEPTGVYYSVPTNIILRAAATNVSSITVTSMLFLVDGRLVGTATNAPFQTMWYGAETGNHWLTTVALTADGERHVSTPVQVMGRWKPPTQGFKQSITDLSIPLVGFPIMVNRVYDSDDITEGDFGRGWHTDYAATKLKVIGGKLGQGWKGTQKGSSFCIEEATTHAVQIILPSGGTMEFRPVLTINGTETCCNFGGSPANGVGWASIVFEDVDGNGGRLTVQNAATMDELYIYDSDFIWPGALQLYTEEEGFPFEPSGYIYQSSSGEKLEFNSSGVLTKTTDLNGNYLSYSSGGITHSSGKQVKFTRDGSGRITSVVDPLGWETQAEAALPVIKYDYDSVGNMVAVYKLTDRADTNSYVTTFYRYDNKRYPFYLTEIRDQNNGRIAENVLDRKGRIIHQVDGLGQVASLVVDEANLRLITTNKVGVATINQFDAAGRPISVTVDGQLQNAVTYDIKGRKISQTDANGATSWFAYDGQDRVIAVTNALRLVTTQSYGDYDRPTVTGDAKGYEPINEYDGNGNLSRTIQVAAGLTNITAYGYDVKGNQTSVTNALGTAFQMVTYNNYNQYGWLTNSIDAAGVETRYRYDANGNQTNTTIITGTYGDVVSSQVHDAQNRVIRFYDALGSSNLVFYNFIGKQSFTVDKQGRTNFFYYDAAGQLTNTTSPDGLFTWTKYDGEGRVTESYDRSGRGTTNYYDGKGRILRTILPDGSTNGVNSYDAGGRVIAMTDPIGNITYYGYDSLGRRTSITNALGQVTWFGYDANGNQTIFTNALGFMVSNRVDELNRVTNVLHLSTNGTVMTQTFTVYDVLGRRSQAIDAATNITAYGYDVMGRLTSVTNALGTTNQVVTRYGYDELGNQVSQTDAKTNVTLYTYDKLGRRLTRELPEGQKEFYVYDMGGLKRRTNFNGTVISYTNDVLNRLVGKGYSDGTSVTYTYTTAGERASMTDVSGLTTYFYNSRGWLTNKTIQFAWVATPVSITYSNDITGKLEGMGSSTMGGTQTSYTYDVLNRLKTATSASSGETEYFYDPVGNLSNVEYHNGVVHSYDYDAQNRLTNLFLTKGITTLASYAYTLGPTGNRTRLTELGGRQVHYTYDLLYRLMQERVTNAPAGPNGIVDYQMDLVGNRTSQTSTLSGISSTNFSYNFNDWLSVDDYDASGNTTNSTKGVDVYDVENRLIQRTQGTNVITIVYNGDGHRVKKTVNGTDTWYLVDDRNHTGYAQVLEELALDEGELIPTRVYSYGQDLVAQQQVIGGVWTTHYYGYDGQGSVRYLINHDGSITDSYDYDAYGNLISQTYTGGSVTPNLYRYTGEQWDNDLSFYFLRARYHNQETGRLWNRDSYEGNGGIPLTLHKYLYCYANPVNLIDPSGHWGSVDMSATVNLISSISVRVAPAALRIPGRIALRGFMRWAWISGGIGAGVQTLMEDTELGMETGIALRLNPTGSQWAYQNKKCVEFAVDALDVLKKRYEDDDVKRIIFDMPAALTPGFIMAKEGFGLFGGQAISDWAHHEGVIHNGRVYDNNVPFGVPRLAWENGYELFVYGVGELTIGQAAALNLGTIRVE